MDLNRLVFSGSPELTYRPTDTNPNPKAPPRIDSPEQQVTTIPQSTHVQMTSSLFLHETLGNALRKVIPAGDGRERNLEFPSPHLWRSCHHILFIMPPSVRLPFPIERRSREKHTYHSPQSMLPHGRATLTCRGKTCMARR